MNPIQGIVPSYVWSFEISKTKDNLFELLCHKTKEKVYGTTPEELYDQAKKIAQKEEPYPQCVIFRFY